ncbi:ABC transporter ATP-binding protein [Paenibacillus sp. IB182496]|uniref:ABC transporter ATP-binding protein n=1 Tax=Paenibacillus sabuli TaxID=2772509 RepID=A0A927BT99_9BACL|nr:ABC transporter ATP-binding protein [Paenibacillus sabuli]MBD2845496.1 ABC transporter ATP-binding protein [Paenibacillus sabuli]
MTVLEASHLTVAYGDKPIVQDLNLTIPQGRITVFIGSNGCGKSTLLRTVARLLKPVEGAVLLDGRDIASMATKEVARQLAILPQGPSAPEGLTVRQLVRQGRYPHQSWLKQWSAEDERMVQAALQATRMEALADRAVDALSGGQRQRAWIAMTLAQGTGTLLLDEPTTYLDLTHQIEILDMLDELNAAERRTIVMVLHDLNLAARYADHIVAVREGRLYAEGPPEDVMTAATVEQVFGLSCRIVNDPCYGTPMCIPLGRRRAARGAS